MAADGNTDNFQGLVRYLNIWFFLNEFFSKKIHYKVLDLETQLIFSILWAWSLGPKSKKLPESLKAKLKLEKRVWNELQPNFFTTT